MKLDFIIPTKGRPDDLARGLGILQELYLRESPPGLELGVCISDSSSAPVDSTFFAKFCPHIQVKCVHSPNARSFIENLQIAISLSTADYGWLMGDDDFITEGALLRVAKMLADDPSMIHGNAILRNSHLNHEERLIPKPPNGEQIYDNIPQHRIIEDITYISCLILKIRFLADHSVWLAAKPCEVAPHLRCIANAVANGNSITTTEPLVVIEKNETVLNELKGIWCILIGYEMALARHNFLIASKPNLKDRKLGNVIQEVRMHLILSIFRTSFPSLAEEASNFKHQYPGVRLFKKMTYVVTNSRKIRQVLQKIGGLVDSRCGYLEI